VTHLPPSVGCLARFVLATIVDVPVGRSKAGFLASQPTELTDELLRKNAALNRVDNGCCRVAETDGQIVGNAMLDPLPLAAVATSSM
jgi:hypothetical protein